MSALRDFAAKALETNRIGSADLRRLQLDVLPQRVTTTDEAELLLTVKAASRSATPVTTPNDITTSMPSPHISTNLAMARGLKRPKALENNGIGFGDPRRLQRDVLPQRITTTDEAELLLTIDVALGAQGRRAMAISAGSPTGDGPPI
jgi:hypothetical protein